MLADAARLAVQRCTPPHLHASHAAPVARSHLFVPKCVADKCELEQALKGDTRHAETPEQIKLAAKLLDRHEMVVVLGVPTRTKIGHR